MEVERVCGAGRASSLAVRRVRGRSSTRPQFDAARRTRHNGACVTQFWGKGDLFLVQAAVGSVVIRLSAKSPRAASPLLEKQQQEQQQE